MKVGIVLDQQLHNGGGFQQSLNAIQQLLRIRPEWLSVEVFTTVAANVTHPSLAGISVRLVEQGILERLRRVLLSKTLPGMLDSRLARYRVVTNLERVMQAQGVDLVYFVSPSGHAPALRSLPYVLTVWDLCHRDHPEFPEVAAGSEFARREDFYRYAINRSYLTLSDSEELNGRIVHRYGADPDRLVAMPFQPASFASNAAEECGDGIVARLGLPQNYLFYPAQFWPHKNHVRILQALARLKNQGLQVPAVFCGGDKNNKGYVQSLAEELGVADQIVFTGFVDEREMQGLYFHSLALVMPTYFGPTNLPPLEAWSMKKPVIYSAPLAAQVGDAALCVNPDSVVELAEAIARVYNDGHLVETLVAKGVERLQQLGTMRAEAEALFLEKLEAFNNRRLCWGKR